MMNNLSVIIPTHKSKYLEKVLIALSKQTVRDFEVIIVENPVVTIQTMSLASQYNFKLIESGLGSNLARDTGVKNASGNIIAFLDDDAVPCETWVEQILALVKIYPTFGIFGGPLINEYLDEKPLWIIRDFVANLSEIDWKEPTNGPFEILDGVIDKRACCTRYIVSANMFFFKERYEQARGLNTEIGYHGKDKLISNDEIEFVNRCKKIGSPGLMYSPNLITRHQIGAERMNLEWFRRRFYGQGWADGDMARRYNINKSDHDKYHDHFHYLNHITTLIDIDNIMGARQDISNEDITREFITNLCICRTDFMTGYQNGLLGRELWNQNL